MADTTDYVKPPAGLGDDHYLRFEERSVAGRRTPIIDIYSTRHGDLLGRIAWYSQWRQFAFYPEPGTVWNPACLEIVRWRIRVAKEARADARR